jgi:hypothetical protein
VVGGLRIYQTRSAAERCEYTKLHEFYGNCAPIDSISKKPFGYPECGDGEATSSAPCYFPSEYRGAVDIDHNEGFKFDGSSGRFEM